MLACTKKSRHTEHTDADLSCRGGSHSLRSHTLKHVHTEFSLSPLPRFFSPSYPPLLRPPFGLALFGPVSPPPLLSLCLRTVTRSSFFIFFAALSLSLSPSLPTPSYLSSFHLCPPVAPFSATVPLPRYRLPSLSLVSYPEKGWLLERKRVASGGVAGVSRTGRRISRRPRERETRYQTGVDKTSGGCSERSPVSSRIIRSFTGYQ